MATLRPINDGLPVQQATPARYRFELVQGGDAGVVTSWLRLIDRVCQWRGAHAEVALFFDVPGLSGHCAELHQVSVVPLGRHSARHHPPRPTREVVTISGSGALSPALLNRFQHFRVVCARPALTVNDSLRHALHAFRPKSWTAPRVGVDASLRSSGWRPRCSIITSMFDGDAFVDPFLEDCSAWSGYEEMEHFIVRPASPGRREHAAVMQHLADHGNAVYIRLDEDPGLYEVWNLCCRLSTSPYLTTASIDDRRSPAHLARLVDELDDKPGVDVTSSALRVTESARTGWLDSGRCATWYADEPSDEYLVERLWRGNGPDAVPHNIPHCMPVWRRRIHATTGDFDERNYGPSADWEFWLRAGRDGSVFSVVRTPLGLHLRSPGSYWHRHPDNAAYTRRIIGRHIHRSDPTGLKIRLQWFHRLMAELERRRNPEGALRFFWILQQLRAGLFTNQWKHIPFQVMVRRRLRRELGPSAECLLAPTREWSHEVDGLGESSSVLFWFLVEACHGLSTSTVHADTIALLRDAFDELLIDSRSTEVACACALVRRLQNDPDGERYFLRLAHDGDAEQFWSRLQAVYRFTAPLEELSRAVLDTPDFVDFAAERQCSNLFFFPDYSSGNPYQSLLYRGLERSGVNVSGLNDLAALRTGELAFEPGDILHVHWINSVYQDVEIRDHGRAIDQFLSDLQGLRQKGLRIWWTIHNRYSHDIADLRLDRAFRRRLSAVANRLLVHHPCLPDLVQEWLPADRPVSFLEHGNYIDSYENTVSRKRARQGLGLARDDITIAMVGMVKPYKAFDGPLSTLRGAMQRFRRLQLIQMGPVFCEKTRVAIRQFPAHRLTSHDVFTEAADCQHYLNASDFVLLSYRDILTSGCLYLAFSFGIPVIAPAQGSIPAYVVNNWNGFLYEDVQDIEAILAHVHDYSVEELDTLRNNALHTARSLKWPE